MILFPFSFPMLKPLLQSATVAFALAGCASGPAVPPITPEQRAETLEGVQQLPGIQRDFKVRIGQLLGLEEALKTRASELAQSNPTQAKELLDQAAVLRRQIDTSAAGVPQMLLGHTDAAHRTYLEVLVALRAAGIRPFEIPDAVKPLIDRLKAESRERGERIAALRQEITRLQGGAFQQEIATREAEIERLIAQQDGINGAYLAENWGEDQERPRDFWDQISQLVEEIQSSHRSGLGVSPATPAIPAPPAQ